MNLLPGRKELGIAQPPKILPANGTTAHALMRLNPIQLLILPDGRTTINSVKKLSQFLGPVVLPALLPLVRVGAPIKLVVDQGNRICPSERAHSHIKHPTLENRVGFEPTTRRLKGRRSTTELPVS